MQFLYPALTAGFLLVLVPLLIHLINMMRHRRVHWAAMEFLLQSYKKHRRWVWLKQLLLLLARMAVVALVVAMLAQLVTQRRYEGLFGNSLTHHYVLLDDSMSMSDRAGSVDALESGWKFTRQLGIEAAQQELRQRFTLVRFSTAQAATLAAAQADAADDAPVAADLNAVDVDSRFHVQLEELRLRLAPTELSMGPAAALQVARRLMQQNRDENPILYLVSDFRSKDWNNPSELRQLLGDLEQAGAKIQLVNCCRTRRPNLSITDLRPTEETRASGVPLFMQVAVTNYSDAVAEQVQLRVRTHYFAAGEQFQQERPVAQVDESPLLQIEQIEPGETVTQRVQVFFPQPGKHVVEAILGEDSVAADNRRWCVVEFPEYETVLVVDGDPNQRNAFYLQAIMDPGQRARTGIRPEVESTAFLRDTTVEVLRRYSAIYLFDVDRLDDRALTNLETYVAEGGGLAIFAGPQVNLDFYNEQFFRGGTGLWPLPLERDDLLMVDPVETAPDVEIPQADHPVFRDLTLGQNPIIRTVRVERYLRPPGTWGADAESGVRVLARLRGGAPLAVEKSHGEGRVLAFLTTYAPYWNDLALGPGVILALRLQSYLGFSQRHTSSQQVGTGIDVRLDREKYRAEVRMFTPNEDANAPLLIERSAEKLPDDNRFLLAALRPQETWHSGIYEMWLNRVDGTLAADRFAVNVDPREGDLAQTPAGDIIAQLDPVPVEMDYADEFASGTIQDSGFNQSLLLMGLLILLLLGEQLLAYFTSYHPTRRLATSMRGGRSASRTFTSSHDDEDLGLARQAAGGDGPYPTPSDTTTTGRARTPQAQGVQQ